jgi:hypothetical protein
MPETIALDSELEPGTFFAVIQICYDPDDLEAAGLDIDQLVLHRWVVQQQIWLPAGGNPMGESEPTERVGDYGWFGNCIWAVVDRFSDFVAADGCPDDPDKEAPGQCGCGVTDEDSDGDQIADCVDSCPDDPDNDIDGDTVCGNIDNCPATPNPDQADVDNDGKGDACDDDVDGDGVANDLDNCPLPPTPDQQDGDNDGVGDACAGTGQPNPDADGDGVIDDFDNCPSLSNPGQEDQDGDGRGDACEDDSDGDGVIDDLDNCPQTPNPDQLDQDGDGMGDACSDPVQTCGAGACGAGPMTMLLMSWLGLCAIKSRMHRVRKRNRSAW